MVEASIMVLIAPIIASGIWAAVGFINSWLGPDHTPDWSKLIVTFLIGIAIGVWSTYSGTVPTYEIISVQMAANIGIVAALDKAVHALMKLKNNYSS